ncbi:MAG TPA: SrtB family sortase [Olsenella sp.]|nr:SrtB family sortase [Olsenella sp.]
MAAHFKQPGDDRGAHARLGGNPRTRLNTRRGGEESYHAPEGNPHAASVPHRHDATYIPVVSEPSDQRRGHNRRRRDHGFVETDPYDLSGRRSRDPRKRVGRVVSVLLFVVGIALIAVAAGMWIHNQWQYHEQDRINEELATYADVSDNGSTPPQVDWEALKAVNDEVVGWLQIPGTAVNFPVYQASDNEKYLHTSAEGNYSLGGQVFMDYENAAPGMVDAQTIVYGHHLRNGAMFKPVSDMANQEMFDSVSTVWYVTEEATYELEPLLLYETDANDTNVRRFSFESVDELRSYLTELLGRAVTSRSDAADLIANASNVLTLCTCNYDNGDSGRTLLVCVPKSAAASADAATTSE